MRFADAMHPTETELREWASQRDASWPKEDWDLILSWDMVPNRLRLFITLAADRALPGHEFFLGVLHQWVSYVARQEDFEIERSQYDQWLDQARGERDPAVKEWRRRASLVFQGIEPFDYDSWWSGFRTADRIE